MKNYLLLISACLLASSAFARDKLLWDCDGDGIELLQIRSGNTRESRAQVELWNAIISWDAGAGDFIENKTFQVEWQAPRSGEPVGPTVFSERNHVEANARFTLTIYKNSSSKQGLFGGHVTANTPRYINQSVTCKRGK